MKAHQPSVWKRLFDLAVAVGDGSAEDRGLCNERYGFDGTTRYLLDLRASGVEGAARACDSRKAVEIARMTDDWSSPLADPAVERELMASDAERFSTFIASHFPWEAPWSPTRVTPRAGLASIRDALESSPLGTALEAHGFRRERGDKLRVWSYVCCGRHEMTRISASLNQRSQGVRLSLFDSREGVDLPLAYPFFFSGSTFVAGMLSAALERHSPAFVRMLPELLLRLRSDGPELRSGAPLGSGRCQA